MQIDAIRNTEMDDVKMQFGLLAKRYSRVQTNYRNAVSFKFWMAFFSH